MEDKSLHLLNPHCKKPVINGSKLTDRWFIYFYYIEDGQRKMFRQSKGLNDQNLSLADKRKKAQELLMEIEERLTTSIFDTKTKTFIPTATNSSFVKDLLEEYLESKKGVITEVTFANYSSVYKSFKCFIKDMRLIELSKTTLKSYFKSLEVKPQTKRSYKIYLSSFFNWAIETKGLQISNLTHNLKLENNHPTERHRVYSKSELESIITYCTDKNDQIMKTIIYLVYGAQVRISEILKMQISDFKLNDNKIVLPKGKGKIKNKIKIILIDEPLKQYLLSLPINYDNTDIQTAYFIGIKQPYAKAMFVQQYPLSKNTIDTRFKQLKKDLNIGEHKTLYSFKHTGNVNLLLSGADLIELMYKNGHTKISQTETYARQLIEQVPEMKYIRKTREDLDFK